MDRTLKQNKITLMGFTLAELLIALAILGVIATFTIPKNLDSGNDNKKNAIAKEMIAAMSGAYQAYKLENSVSASTRQSDLTPYLNYVSITTIGIDGACSAPPFTANCNTGSSTCFTFHKGAVIRLYDNQSFNGTGITNALEFRIDVDGAMNSERSIQTHLYYNGRVVTREHILDNSTNSQNTYSAASSCQPPWFKWSN